MYKKNQKGNVLIIVLIFVTLFSTIAYLGFEIGNSEQIIAEKQKIKTRTELAATSSINSVLAASQADNSDINRLILSVDSSGKVYCITGSGILDGDCSGTFDEDGKIKAFSIVKQSTSNCDVFGYSNLNTKCFSMYGLGQYTPIEIKSGEYQKIQVRTVSSESGGVYEL